MRYKLILAKEAEQDLLLWKKSGQKKDLLKLLSFVSARNHYNDK